MLESYGRFTLYWNNRKIRRRIAPLPTVLFGRCDEITVASWQTATYPRLRAALEAKEIDKERYDS